MEYKLLEKEDLELMKEIIEDDNMEFDLNNLQDFIFDKYNRPGYLIYVNGYYIYQYINDPLNVPMYYRSLYKIDISNDIKLFEYMKYNKMLELFKEEEIKLSYDFDSVMS